MIFLLLGIPLLVISQFTDAYRFMYHSYRKNAKQIKVDGLRGHLNLSKYFMLYHLVEDMYNAGTKEMNVRELVLKFRDQLKVLPTIFEKLFNRSPEDELDIKYDDLPVKTFSIWKRFVWVCVKDETLPKDDQVVDICLMRDILLEMKSQIDF